MSHSLCVGRIDGLGYADDGEEHFSEAEESGADDGDEDSKGDEADALAHRRQNRRTSAPAPKFQPLGAMLSRASTGTGDVQRAAAKPAPAIDLDNLLEGVYADAQGDAASSLTAAYSAAVAVSAVAGTGLGLNPFARGPSAYDLDSAVDAVAANSTDALDDEELTAVKTETPSAPGAVAASVAASAAAPRARVRLAASTAPSARPALIPAAPSVGASISLGQVCDFLCLKVLWLRDILTRVPPLLQATADAALAAVTGTALSSEDMDRSRANLPPLATLSVRHRKLGETTELLFYWLDAYEEAARPGTLHLFGKVGAGRRVHTSALCTVVLLVLPPRRSY